jgi:hypothetical protein
MRGPRLAGLLLAATLIAIPTQAAKRDGDPRSWIVDFSPGHIAFVRIMSEDDPLHKAVELKIAYKDPLSREGGDVMAFDLDFSCPGPPGKVVGDVTFRKGELWTRNPPARLSEISESQFDAMRGRTTLEKARGFVCESSRVRLKDFVPAKVSPLTQIYFALVNQGVHYQLAAALANVSASDRLSKSQLGHFGVPQDKREGVIEILNARELTTESEQAVP